MKKAFVIAVIILIAVFGLTSFNGNDSREDSTNDRLLASVKTVKDGVPLTANGKKND